MRSLLLSAFLVASVPACVSNPTDDQLEIVEDETFHTLRIVSGDGQTVTQHAGAELRVEVVDQDGNPVVGVPITFEPAPGSAFAYSVASETGEDGTAYGAKYVHVAGDLQILASAPNLDPVTFTIHVTPTVHTYDGWYDCADPSASSFSYETIKVEDGVVSSPSTLRPMTTESLDESDGSLDVHGQNGESTFLTMTGALSIDALGQASGTGSYAIDNVIDNSGPIYNGTWTCTRR